MQRVQLEVSPREPGGKGAARRLRATGGVPAVVYGSGSTTLNLQVNAHTLGGVIRHGTNQLIDLIGDASVKGKLVLLKEIQRDPVSHQLTHADFYQVDTSQKIDVSIPVHYNGKPHGVEMGGSLEQIVRDIDVRCLPLAIPDSFELDVSKLDIGDALHASDLVLPEGVDLETDLETVIVHVVAPRAEETTEAEETDVAPDAAAPKDGAEAPADETAKAE